MGSNGKMIRKKDLTFWQKSYIPEILKGMRQTIAEMFKPKFTFRYPEERFRPNPSFSDCRMDSNRRG